MTFPDFSHEEPLWQQGYSVIGIDEVGRGAFAGPVGVGGVVFSYNLSPSKKQKLLSLGINDSKKLSKKKREELSMHIKDLAEAWHISFVSVPIINNIGIGKATFEGMRDVVMACIDSGQARKTNTNPYALIDAFTIPNVSVPQKGIIRGDSISISIAAASIIAKVERDKLMAEIGIDYPLYSFDKHSGYGTASHRLTIKEYGMTPHHRDDFCRKTLSFVV